MTHEPPLHADGDASATRRDPFAVALLALCWLCLLHTAWRTGPTFDEHFYIAAGHAYWETGDFALNREHPPLGKLLVGLPLFLAPHVSSDAHALERVGYPVWFFFQENGAHLALNLFLARLPVTLLTVLCAWAVHRKAARVFGQSGGRVALLAFAFNPNVLAQGSLAALDGTLMALFFFAVLAFVELLRKPSWRLTLVAALLFGLANLTKQTALLLGPGFALGAVATALGRRSFVPLGSCALVFLGGLGVFAAGYGFEAKSLDQAWGSAHYAQPIPKPNQADSARAHERLVALCGERAAAQPGADSAFGPEFVRRVGGAPGAAAGIGLFAEPLAAGAESERAACEVLLAFAGPGAPASQRGALRAAAFYTVLEAPGTFSEARSRTLAALAGTDRFAHLAGEPPVAQRAWSEWWTAGGARTFEARLFTQAWLGELVPRLFGERRPVPLFSALKGLDYQLDASSLGHGTVFRGRPLLPKDFKDGNPYPEYYAVVLAIKNPLLWLVLVVAGIALSARGSRRAPGWDRVRRLGLIGAPLLLLAFFSSGKALMGARYVLPVFPFLALAAGRVGASYPRAALGIALLAALAGVSVHPHHLMFYNALAGGSESPHGGPRISVTSDDWGQGVRAMGVFVERHAPELAAAGGLHYEPYTVADPAAYGLERLLPVTGPVQGIVAVHALAYWRDLVPGSGVDRKYAWLDDYEPFCVVDRSIYVYDTRVPAPGGDPLASWR